MAALRLGKKDTTTAQNEGDARLAWFQLELETNEKTIAWLRTMMAVNQRVMLVGDAGGT